MPMLKPASMRSSAPSKLAKTTALLSMLILGACSTEKTKPPPATNLAQTKPLACTDFPPLKFNPGKPGGTTQDVLDALKQPISDPTDPLAWVRGVVGDTKSTRAAISNYDAARRALGCE